MKRPHVPNPLIALKKTVVAEVRQVYADLAEREKTNLAFERNCTGIAECCHFVLTGATPYLTKAEALVAAKAWRASGRTKLPETDGDACPFLSKERKCMIYNDRPFGCRTHFCAGAGGEYARRDLIDLIQRLEAIDLKLEKGKQRGGRQGHHGPTALPQAVGEALNEESGTKGAHAF
ncbi:Putative zinc-or iron-chelating domain-containing protein [Verrucomicrobium sp. GAS474]|uniref:YkgJ family cysteine cluster protein n=1 Tax=Verrucomicrobium sp. GAS474 TaxID=1882831 RepID=UPI00087B6EF6|nr:YkgJ family cysteine cluster protein [Verrucomicrobium sp. GAS474]SDU11079.1 Putative zinc-or iron-chelating domain-containing protein [Verrucomicrobium sp. GAS474]